MLRHLAACVALVATCLPGERVDAARTAGRAAVPRSATSPIAVSAAISLSTVLEDLARLHAARGGGRVAFNFAASNVLARQIVNGARVDMFISADERQMDVVERAGLVVPGTRRPLVGNRLALITPVGVDFVGSVQSLADPRVRRIAIGDPAAVPAGVYTKEYLERAGLWAQLQPKLVPTGSVRGALAAVAHGGAEAGFVYVTDAGEARDVRIVARIEGPAAPRIVYPMCIVTSGRQPAASAAFLSFLTSEEAAPVFRRYAFTAVEPSEARRRR